MRTLTGNDHISAREIYERSGGDRNMMRQLIRELIIPNTTPRMVKPFNQKNTKKFSC